MRTSASVVALAVVVVSAGSVRAEDAPTRQQGRGPATVAGLALLAIGLGGAGFGVGGLLNMAEAQTMLTRYIVGDGGTSDATTSDVLEQRVARGTTFAVVGWVAAGAGLLGGVLLLLVDAPGAPHVAFIPLQSGGGLISYALAW